MHRWKRKSVSALDEQKIKNRVSRTSPYSTSIEHIVLNKAENIMKGQIESRKTVTRSYNQRKEERKDEKDDGE